MSAILFALFASLVLSVPALTQPVLTQPGLVQPEPTESVLTESVLTESVHAQTIAPPPPMPKPAIETNCPPTCVRGTPEHDVWWCGFFNGKTQEDCEADTQIGCRWAAGKCVPEG